jgi:hypothetical protein
MTTPYDPDIHGTAEAYIRERRPHRYASIARMVDLSMSLSGRPCTGNGCDEGRHCPRHARITAVVDRYLRLKGRATP